MGHPLDAEESRQSEEARVPKLTLRSDQLVFAPKGHIVYQPRQTVDGSNKRCSCVRPMFVCLMLSRSDRDKRLVTVWSNYSICRYVA